MREGDEAAARKIPERDDYNCERAADGRSTPLRPL